jgi:hypothetical protein
MVLSNYISTFQKEIRTHYIVRAKKIKSHQWRRLDVIGRKYAERIVHPGVSVNKESDF